MYERMLNREIKPSRADMDRVTGRGNGAAIHCRMDVWAVIIEGLWNACRTVLSLTISDRPLY
jgi:hypothetical protein